jgi:hypothetical protein
MMTVIIVGSVDGAQNGCHFGSRDDASGHEPVHQLVQSLLHFQKAINQVSLVISLSISFETVSSTSRLPTYGLASAPSSSKFAAGLKNSYFV